MKAWNFLFILLNFGVFCVSSCSTKSAVRPSNPVLATGAGDDSQGPRKPNHEGVWKEEEGDRSSSSPANGHNEEVGALKSRPTQEGDQEDDREISQRLRGPDETHNNNDDDENSRPSSSSRFNGHHSSSNHQQHLPSHKSHKPLTLVHFANKSIQCNDKTTAGYYVRNSSGRNSNIWIVFLEGGWFCFDERSCQSRWLRLKHLMTSSDWPRYKYVGGILSPDPNENPYWWNANHAFVPYCSSDFYSGTSTGEENGTKFSFMGALIVDEVIKTLIRNGGLTSDSTLILAGSSAGGTGVLINLDRVEGLMNEKFGIAEPGGPPRVRGISDSGWFIDKLPSYSEKVDCNDVILCPPEISLKKGATLWNSRLPQNCQNSYPDDPWACFYGYRIYPTLKASLFVFQWLFDEAQMLVNNVPTPALKKEEWDYVYRVGDELKKTLINVTNVFIPACMAHTVLTHKDWKMVEVNSVYLPRALKCWESGGSVGESNSIPSSKVPSFPHNRYWDEEEEVEEESSLTNSLSRRNPKHRGKSEKPITSSKTTEVPEFIVSNDSRRNKRRHNRHRLRQSQSSNKDMVKRKRGKEPEDRRRGNENSNKRRHIIKSGGDDEEFDTVFRRGKQRQRRRHHEQSEDFSSSSNNSPRRNNSRNVRNNNNQNHRRQEESGGGNGNNHLRNRGKRKNRKRRWFSVCDAGENNASGSGGDIRLIEKCSWPQCNKSCPKLLNPLTGEEVDFKDLLKSFGLDMSTMAKALGIDLATLNNMDPQVLLQMLTQHA